MPEKRIKFRYQYGSAEEGRLNLYDGAKALEGVARTTSIITHAYLNGETRVRGEAAHGAEFYIRAPRQGSFLYEAVIWSAGAISGGLFYDFVKYACSEAVGYFDREEPIRRSLEERIEPTLGELGAALESPLNDVHRPIRKDRDIELFVTRPRGEVLAHFDYETAGQLLPRTVDPPHEIIGNVTRFNTNTGWGRLYDRTEERSISFILDANIGYYERSLVTWSLHERNLGREGTLRFDGDALVSSTGIIKRYNINNLVQIESYPDFR